MPASPDSNDRSRLSPDPIDVSPADRNGSDEPTLDKRCASLIAGLGIAPAEQIRSVAPLTGGVASDIAVVELPDRRIAVKFALAKLRVAEDWRAPVDRNAAEYAWLEFAGSAVPGSAPRLYGRDPSLNGFAMEFVQGENIHLWKAALLEGRPIAGEAGRVGDALGRIHAASTAPAFDTTRFHNQRDFHDLRLDPYFGFTASVHPDLAGTLRQLIRQQENCEIALVHGDVSPKNILFNDELPVFLDAECATMGDPAFDVAFCLNHLALKTFHMPHRAGELLSEFTSLWDSYRQCVSWEVAEALESRVCALLPALMLARIDGKSPVEYLDDATRGQVREFAKARVADTPAKLSTLVREVAEATGGSRE